ncbi:hypothetical protein OSTOST_01720 [Ostertagia ostertagi]
MKQSQNYVDQDLTQAIHTLACSIESPITPITKDVLVSIHTLGDIGNIFGKTTQERYNILPYQATDVKIMNVTAVTVQMPSHSPMNKKFAQSESETIILPDSFQVPVVCRTRYDAQRKFSKCENKMTCSCSTGTSPHICECNKESIGHIRLGGLQSITAEGSMEIYPQGTDLAVDSLEEITLYIRSSMLTNSSELVVDDQCTAQVTELSVAEIKCSNFTTIVKCSAENITTELNLNFNKALIEETCSISCGNTKSNIALKGHLFYHPVSNDSIFFIIRRRDA